MVAQTLDRAPLKIEPGEDPRTALAAWVTNPGNEAFSAAMVNRLWKHFMGVGLVEPVDDLRSSNPPTNPALLRMLSAEFVNHGYDLKQVMGLILNSRSYQLASDTTPENQRDHHYFSHYYARRLQAEVLADALCSATGVPDEFPGYPVGLRAIQLPEPKVDSYFLSLFGRSERVTACACERDDNVSLPQLLTLNNGDETGQKIQASSGRVARLLRWEKDNSEATAELFLAAFGRPPTDEESKAMTAALASGESREAVYHDLMWALLNSKEFSFNH
jgi:hypothetical protein